MEVIEQVLRNNTCYNNSNINVVYYKVKKAFIFLKFILHNSFISRMSDIRYHTGMGWH